MFRRNSRKDCGVVVVVVMGFGCAGSRDGRVNLPGENVCDVGLIRASGANFTPEGVFTAVR